MIIEEIEKPIDSAGFHGENWMRCPKCKKTFEYYEAIREHGFKRISGDIYRHECGKLLDIS